MKKIVIIGGIAAGTSAAAKARRNSEEAEIKIFDADEDISYSGCELPYYVGLEIEGREQLVPRDVKFLKQKYNVDVYTNHRVVKIQPKTRVLTVKNLITGAAQNILLNHGVKQVFNLSSGYKNYDKQSKK